MEERTELKMHQVDFKCPKCETGYLKFGGPVLTSNPPQYPHVCDNPDCDYTEIFDKTYPDFILEKVKKRKPRTKKTDGKK